MKLAELGGFLEAFAPRAAQLAAELRDGDLREEIDEAIADLNDDLESDPRQAFDPRPRSISASLAPLLGRQPPALARAVLRELRHKTSVRREAKALLRSLTPRGRAELLAALLASPRKKS